MRQLIIVCGEYSFLNSRFHYAFVFVFYCFYFNFTFVFLLYFFPCLFYSFIWFLSCWLYYKYHIKGIIPYLVEVFLQTNEDVRWYEDRRAAFKSNELLKCKQTVQSFRFALFLFLNCICCCCFFFFVFLIWIWWWSVVFYAHIDLKWLI